LIYKGLLILLFLTASLLTGCLGGATETETGTAQINGQVKRPDGSPAVGARVRLRQSGFQAGSVVQPAESGRVQGDTVTDAAGRFAFNQILGGEYLVEALFSEGYGAALKFTVPPAFKRIDLKPLILQPIVTVTGRVRFSDSSLAPAFVHVLGTEQWAMADSATGAFILWSLPPGIFDLRVSTPMPFFPAKDFPGQVVQLPSSLAIGDLVLDKVSKQEFVLAGGKLAIPGIEGGNPVLYDNDFGHNTWDNEFLWALASLGKVDLRGNIVTVVPRDPLALGSEDISSWAREARLSRLSGMRNIPEPILGSRRRLAMPASGQWQDLLPESNPGVQLMVAEARKASAEKPLIVVASGELTTVANAILLDPSIVDRMVVFGVYNQGLNAKDSLASNLVARKCRFVEWGRDYFWAGPGPSAASLPNNSMGVRLSANRDTSTFAPLFFADFAALSFLVDGRSWTSARNAKVTSPPLNATFGSSGSSDFIDIPKEGNDWALMDKVFFAAFADSGAYHPWPVPGPVEGISFKTMSGVAMDSISGEGDIVTGIGSADWMEYALDVPAEGNYDLILRNRCITAAAVRVDGREAASRADLDLPAASGWVETRTTLLLKKGVQNVRLTTVSGSWQLGRLTWEKAP
jgi:hypothetical protein